MKLSWRADILGKVLFAKFQVLDKPHTYTVGITSRCVDGKHVLFADWDGVSEKIVRWDISCIIKEFELSDCYIFRSGNGFHMVCLDKMPFADVVKVQGHTCCDYAFRVALQTFNERSWVLRVVKKGENNAPKFIGIIRGSGKREKSLAHATFLNKYYGVGVDTNAGVWDTENDICFIKYMTSKCKKGEHNG